jgi:hypothetical protein
VLLGKIIIFTKVCIRSSEKRLGYKERERRRKQKEDRLEGGRKRRREERRGKDRDRETEKERQNFSESLEVKSSQPCLFKNPKEAFKGDNACTTSP